MGGQRYYQGILYFYSSFDLNSSDEYAKDFGDYFVVMVKPVIRGSANKPART